MELYSRKMNRMLVFACISTASIIPGACTSDSLDDVRTRDNGIENNALVKNADGTETIFLSNGYQILLEDTTTYVVNFDPSIIEDGIEDLSATRGVVPIGYDREKKPKDNKKYKLNGLEKWGIIPGTVYIGKFITYYKDLPVSEGNIIVPSNKRYQKEDKMGFNPPSLTNVGFHTEIPDSWNGYETGLTQIFYVVSDLSGISWNKNVPCNPADLVWYYQTIAE